MILNFTFKNYRSFRDETQFTMIRESSSASPEWAFPEASTVAAIYGPNAAGKSSLLKAMANLSHMVRASYSRGDSTTGIATKPFLLSAASKTAPSEFFIEFVARNGLRYKYQVTVDSSQVIEEGLEVYKSKRPSVLYERYIGDDGEQVIEFGPSFKGPAKQLKSMTRKNALVLSVAGASGTKSLEPAYTELARSVVFYSAPLYASEETYIKHSLTDGRPNAKWLVAAMSSADLGVSDIGVEKADMDPKQIEMMRKILGNADLDDDAVEAAVEDASTSLSFLHRGQDASAWLSVADESEGTLAALSFFSAFIDTLASGSTALVDEIDSSLHPLIVEEMVKLFADPATNPNQAQLIFTTHDSALIEKSASEDKVVSRDQLWFVEKGPDGASKLFPATACSVRQDENMGRNYLNGRYGALPHANLTAVFSAAIADMAAPKGGDRDSEED